METIIINSNSNYLITNTNFKIFKITTKYTDMFNINNNLYYISNDKPLLLNNIFYKSLTIYSQYYPINIEITYIKSNKRKYSDVDEYISEYNCKLHDNDINICQIYECNGN